MNTLQIHRRISLDQNKTIAEPENSNEEELRQMPQQQHSDQHAPVRARESMER